MVRTKTLSAASSLAAHTAMCVQLEGLWLRRAATVPAIAKTRRTAFRHLALLAAIVLAALWSARALSIVGSHRDTVVPHASAVVSQR